MSRVTDRTFLFQDEAARHPPSEQSFKKLVVTKRLASSEIDSTSFFFAYALRRGSGGMTRLSASACSMSETAKWVSIAASATSTPLCDFGRMPNQKFSNSEKINKP
jgi:hypothetical protein